MWIKKLLNKRNTETEVSKLASIRRNLEFSKIIFRSRGPRWRSWLRHCATSQKVAGSIPDGVIGIFH